MIRGPTKREHRIVARCLLENGILIGSPSEIWSHPSAWRALGTLRECVDAITLLIGGGHAVKASFVQACVMQADGISEVPFLLEEVSEFLVADPEARQFWQDMCNDDRFPHRCHVCGAAAFIGFLQVECKARCSGR